MQRHAAALLISARRLQTFRRLSSNNDAALRPAASRQGLTEAFWTGSSSCQQRGTSCQHRGTHANTPPASLEPSAFRDYRFSQASTAELIRAWVVFRMCGVRSFVNNGQALMTLSNRILGPNLTTALIKHTFFRHFCGGESDAEVQRTIARLQAQGVSAILDYAAEDDVHEGAGTGTQESQQPAAVISRSYDRQGHPVARVYSYASEVQCNKHVDIFLAAIDTAGRLPGQGFAAIKLTALGNPQLLERISSSVSTVRGLFQRFDADGSGYIDRLEFETVHRQIFPDATPADSARVFEHFDQQACGKVDYVSWCQGLSLRQMPLMAQSIHKAYRGREEMENGWLGDLSSSCLTDDEYGLVLAMKGRLQRIVERAAARDVKLMIDAEHQHFQPAIDYLALQLMKQYNVGGRAVIYNTYQAYLRSTQKRMAEDMERARRQGYKFAAKLVRGAYLNLERSRALAKGYPSPVWDTIEQTHASYAACLELLIPKVAGGDAEVLLGTHNEGSVLHAVGLMQQLGLRPGSSAVYFGQLLGMADHLTFTLGANGYPAFKYVPYGRVHEVVPYLLRRAQENASILTGAKADLQLLQAELLRRAGLGRGKPAFAKRT